MSPDRSISKPSLAEKLSARLATSRVVDGLWIGSSHDDPEITLQRVEAALALIARFAPLHYRRVKSSLSRIWVKLIPHGGGCYLHSLKACVLDARVVVSESTTTEWIASAIVHEATHARLERRGFSYDEPVRYRIERICARRELDFARRLPNSEALIEHIEWTIDQCRDGNASLTDQAMWEEIDRGHGDMLRHLGAPEWVISSAYKVRDTIVRIRGFTRRLARAPVS